MARRRGLQTEVLASLALVRIAATGVLGAVLACVGLFFVNVIMGTIAVGVAAIAAFLFIYFWAAVQKAYKELGNRDYMYEPAPVKPIFNPKGHRSDQARYHQQINGPSSPQQFSLG